MPLNVFDIVGPVMIGPSSSHTAGAARIGLVARRLLGAEPAAAEIRLHGSFAKTYRGHGTDKALAAGILGAAIGFMSAHGGDTTGIQIDTLIEGLSNTPLLGAVVLALVIVLAGVDAALCRRITAW